MFRRPPNPKGRPPRHEQADPRQGRAERGTPRPEPPAEGKRGAPAGPIPRIQGDALEGRNVVLEALVRGRRAVRRIWLDEGARVDAKVQRILELAGDRVTRVPRPVLDRLSVTGVHNGVIAEAEPFAEMTVRELLDQVASPFVVLVDEVQYEHNLGAILRSALGAGVDAVIIPVERGKGLTPVVQRVSMGGAEAVPVIREGISSALAQLRRAGVKVVGADMDGVAPWEADLRGPLAIVLGGEDKGLTDPVRKRCDQIIGVPLAGNLESLNVSVTAGVLLFERVRQVARG